jgi:signal recognition particle subunit SRP54
MFSNLSKNLLKIFSSFRGRGILTEDVIFSTLRDIRLSLLQADVALSVVKDFTARLSAALQKEKLIDNLNPEQTIIKIVYDELLNLLGSQSIDSQQNISTMLVVGLQGAGKTSTAAKLAKLYQDKFKKRVLLISLDTYRPAAIDQLQKLAVDNNIDFFDDIDINKDSPLSIAQKASLLKSNYDVLIYDTAGRLYLDESMMNEVKSIKENISPEETLLVIDSMMGQDALNTAKSFNENLGVTGLILTRIDGDARGGAALSAKYITNCQIKYMCTGEKINDIEIFYPERIASRILDKGDMISLIEKVIDENIMQDTDEIMLDKDFDLNSMEKHLRQLEKIGGFNSFLKFIPGMGKIKEQLQQANINEKTIQRQRAIITSMTKQERKNHSILNASRRRRISTGCGQPVSEVNKLIKQFEQMKQMMHTLSSPKVRDQLAAKLQNRVK